MKKTSLPIDIIDQWPEIFNDVDVKAMPLMYVDTMNIHFKDGKVWVIDMAKEFKKHVDMESLEIHLQELLSTYDEKIDNIDIRLDVDRVKKDVVHQTKTFLSNKKKKK